MNAVNAVDANDCADEVLLAQPVRQVGSTSFRSLTMPSRNVGSKRQDSDDSEIPAELAQREAQDRPSSDDDTSHQARSPVDAMHVDAPKKRDKGSRSK